MKVKISCVDGNVYERFDMDNWMGVPKYTSDDETSYLDMMKEIYRKSESSQHKGDEEIGEGLSQIIRSRQSKNS